VQMSPDMKRNNVRRAVEKKYHLPRTIATHTGLEVREVAEILQVLVENGELDYSTEGITAYFEKGKLPDGRIILDPDDPSGIRIEKKVCIVSDEARQAIEAENGRKNAMTGKEVWRQKASLVNAATFNKEPLPTPYPEPVKFATNTVIELPPKKIESLPIEVLPKQIEPAEPENETVEPKTMRQKIILDLKEVENLAAEGLTQEKAAERLNIKFLTFVKKLSKNADLKSAWLEGVKTFKVNKLKNPKPEQQIIDGKLSTALARPVAQVLDEIQTDNRFEYTLEHISKNGHSKKSIEAVKTKLLSDNPVFNNQIETTEKLSLFIPSEFDFAETEKDAKLWERIEADMSYAIAYGQASPHAKETLRMIRSQG
jgi:predicted DNA-binding protein (UPF0251 family)